MPITVNGSGTLTGLSAGGLPDATVTPSDLTQPLTLGTSQPSTSGTAIDFTSIPSWAKRVTVMLMGVSTNGTSDLIMRIGAGSIVSTGYASNATRVGATSSFTSNPTTGFQVTRDLPGSTHLEYGSLVLTNLGSNSWVLSGLLSDTVANSTVLSTGSLVLSGTLDRIRITTINGADTFDAGSINIVYE